LRDQARKAKPEQPSERARLLHEAQPLVVATNAEQCLDARELMVDGCQEMATGRRHEFEVALGNASEGMPPEPVDRCRRGRHRVRAQGPSSRSPASPRDITDLLGGQRPD
jgi:hypothetical protein